MKYVVYLFTVILVSAIGLLPLGLYAQGAVGVALSQTDGTVTTFDASGPLGSLSTSSGFPLVGDCAITPDGNTALVTDWTPSYLHVIDISVPTNPAIDAGSPIALSIYAAEDVSLTPDGEFAVVCGVSNGVAVVDVANRVEISVLNLPAGAVCTSVEVCDDGTSVLVGESNSDDYVRLLTLNASGSLTDTGTVFQAAGQPTNVACAPGSASGAVTTAFSGVAQTFTVPGLAAVSSPTIPTQAQSVRISPDGNQIIFRSVRSEYVMYTEEFAAFDFNAATGAVGSPQFTVSSNFFPVWVGIDTFEYHPSGNTFTAAVRTDTVSEVQTMSSVDGSLVAAPATFAVPYGATGICFNMGDTDNDGVPDADDFCLGTSIPESVPTLSLGNNRYALTDNDWFFDTVTPGNKTAESYSLQDTAGCSCEQIIDYLDLGLGQTQRGCSNSVMSTWIEFVNQ